MNEKMKLESQDIAIQKRDELKELFPSVFTETKNEKGELVESIDFEKLKANLGEFSDVFESRRERYETTWPGKKDCIKLIQQPSVGALRPMKEASLNFDSTDNLFLEGDNLEVLKLLQKSYYGKVKMVYIDPPYNTGKEFIYPDNYSESLDTYLKFAGLVDDDGKKFSSSTSGEGRFHTRWMNMLFPRLYLARNLLTNDGVIFISIDDNELVNLRKICDEIFGETNFYTCLIVRSNSRGQTYKEIAKTHEYILVYGKSEDSYLNELEKTGDKADLNLSDNIGPFNLRELRNRNPKFGRHNRPNLYYPIYVNPSIVDDNGLMPVSLTKQAGFDVELVPLNSKAEESCWRWGKPKCDENIKATTNTSNLVAKSKNDGGYLVCEKYRKSTYKAKSIWNDSSFLTEAGTVETGELDMPGYFDFPKPSSLIKQCIQLGSSPGEIVIDFFAGSSTTAHAVMELNGERKGNRKFIMVQLPVPIATDAAAAKAGFDTIAELAIERLKRVSKKITSSENADDAGIEPDVGVKVFKLNKSNFSGWQSIGPSIPTEELQRQLELSIDHIDANSNETEVLYELLLKAGFDLNVDVEKLKLASKEVFSIAGGHLLIFLGDEISTDLLDAVVEKEPIQFISLDSAFKGNDQLKANAVQTFAARNQGRDKTDQIVFRTV